MSLTDIILTIGLLTVGLVLWLVVLCPSVELGRHERHGRHGALRVLPHSVENRGLDHVVEHYEPNSSTDEQSNPSPEVHGRIVQERA